MPNPYDTTSYASYPIESSYPKRLFTSGRLFGFNASPLESARVLEIGCAAGGNIIPLAHRFPGANFVGFDYSSRQIAEGQQHIARLALNNIALNHESIEEYIARKPSEKFDYILCHGVFSWVSPALQDKIFDICSRHLQQDGLAYISYNVYPGWNMGNTLRELMLWSTRDITDDTEKIAKARSTVANIANGFDDKIFPYEYAKDFKARAGELLKEDDSYLIHEYLEYDNSPTYFYQFAERAQNKKLQFVSESDLSMISAINLPEPFSSQLAQNPDIIELGQHIDFIRNTRFRQSILCHAGRTLNRNIRPETIEQFHIRLEAKPGNTKLNIKNASCMDHLELEIGDVTVNISKKTAIICIALLHERRHQAISYSALCKLLIKHSELSSTKQVREFLNTEMGLISLALAGVLSLHADSDPYTTEISAQPRACDYIRYQASSGHNIISTCKHTTRRVNEFDRIVLGALDGDHGRDDLLAIMEKAIDQGRITLNKTEKNTKTNSAKNKRTRKQLIRKAINTALQDYANDGCLVG